MNKLFDSWNEWLVLEKKPLIFIAHDPLFMPVV